MQKDTVLQHLRETGAMLEGHFLLSSGLHSALYLQCAKVLMHPARAENLCKALAVKLNERFGKNFADIVVSPAMGGVVVGYELARQLSIPAMFAERVEGQFALRRGFSLDAGSRVLMVEDVITTGKSSRECIECIAANGGQVVAAACLIDRSDGDVDIGVPMIALAGIKVPTYPADKIPPDLAAIPAIKPGSRGLK